MVICTEPDSSGPGHQDDEASGPKVDGDTRQLSGRRRVVAAVAGVATAVAAAFLPTSDPVPPTLDGGPVASDDLHRATLTDHLASGGGELGVLDEHGADGP